LQKYYQNSIIQKTKIWYFWVFSVVWNLLIYIQYIHLHIRSWGGKTIVARVRRKSIYIINIHKNACKLTHNGGINRTQLSTRCHISLYRALFRPQDFIVLPWRGWKRDWTMTVYWMQVKTIILVMYLKRIAIRSNRIWLFLPAHFYCKLCATRNTKAESSRGNKAICCQLISGYYRARY